MVISCTPDEPRVNVLTTVVIINANRRWVSVVTPWSRTFAGLVGFHIALSLETKTDVKVHQLQPCYL